MSEKRSTQKSQRTLISRTSGQKSFSHRASAKTVSLASFYVEPVEEVPISLQILKDKHNIAPQFSEDHLEKHFVREKEALDLIFTLYREFRVYYDIQQAELRIQQELLEPMWLLCQRYLIRSSVQKCCTNPDTTTTLPVKTVLREYGNKLKLLHSSNCKMMQSFNNLRGYIKKFRDVVARLDVNINSQFMQGDAYHKPIASIVELFTDLEKYFHYHILKLKYHANQLDPGEMSGIENYKPLVVHSDGLEDFINTELVYCDCLRPKEECSK